ncbi:hypothetical protein QN277_022042 [Acacia crassicarpa]|uniref:PGG domain-containing protein n=1 Tax=Acacia crassicarpa TaxID=499986 RepID=A0AAE1K983_9FABA|nr:hypothetical protein QN277_022042 [Acacia crassicarpa]
MEVENSHNHHHEEEQKIITVLYEASHHGCVPTLRALIQQHPLLLHRINSRTTFIDTPLHISASLGHLEFTKALLDHKPNLATELDSFRSTALHIASAEGHIHIAKELLAAYEQACLVFDKEGRIPLHVAVIRGRLEVVAELVTAKPESLKILHEGKTVLHLCLTYNHLDILKALVDSSPEICDELLNWRDLDGNTVLHLAIMFKHAETVQYLASIPKIQEASVLKNKMGFTASDMVDGIPRDLKSLEIQIMLMSNGLKSDKKETDMNPQAAATSEAAEGTGKKRWRKMVKHMGKWFKHNGEWLEETRGNLSTVATVISTMTFQSVLNPPGGFIQQGIHDSNNTSSSSPLECLEVKRDQACPGDAIRAFRDPNGNFRDLIIYNTIAFVASLGVTLLLISGLPLKNKVVMWMLSMGMIITLTALLRAYFTALYAITPYKLWDTPSLDKALDPSADKMLKVLDQTWLALFGLAAGYVLSAFLVWIVKYCIKFIKHMGKAIHTLTQASVTLGLALSICVYG